MRKYSFSHEKIVGLSISQWLPCPLAIWNLLFGMAILLNLVKMKMMRLADVYHHARGRELRGVDTSPEAPG